MAGAGIRSYNIASYCGIVSYSQGHSSISGACTRWRSEMLILFVLILVTHQITCQLQCPQVSASPRDALDFSSFAVLLDQPEGIGNDGNANDDDQCKLISYKVNC